MIHVHNPQLSDFVWKMGSSTQIQIAIMALRNETQIVKYFEHRPEEDGHAHVRAYVYIETTTKLRAKIIQVPFESIPQI